MKQERVYIGLYNDNHESLFYRKDQNVYYDLKEKRIITSDQIQKDSLIPYKNVIECKSKLKSNVIKLYDLDRMQKISLNKVFLGNVFEIENAVTSKYFDQTDDELSVEISASCDVVKINESVLLYSINEFIDIEYDDFLDMETGTIYDADVIIQNGNQYVPRTEKYLIPIKKVIDMDEEVMEKGKILEKYREYKRR